MGWKAREAAAAAAVTLAVAGATAAAADGDRLGRELAEMQQQVATPREGDELWASVAPGAKDLLERAAAAYAAGHRRAALYRLSAARASLAAWRYVAGLPAEARTQPAAFEAEWKRLGAVLAAPPEPARGSALVRALAEAAQGEVRPSYEASLEYGQATQPLYGLYYLGTAQSSREVAGFAASASVPAAEAGALPALRSLAPELDALEAALLAAYKPPLSIDQHPRFISASGTLKQARELDAAGARYGALLRYLEAALRSAALRGTPAPIDEAAARARAAELEPRLAAGDHSIARLFVEVALSDSANPGADGRGRLTAGVVFADLLPRYFEALQPAAPRPPAAQSVATVTLVRWPYT